MSVATGLSEDELSMIREVFGKRREVTRVLLYGSRAKGSHRPESDVDLAVEGPLTPLQVESIASDLDDLPLPYRFDVRLRSALKSQELIDHIDRVGVVIHSTPSD